MLDETFVFLSKPHIGLAYRKTNDSKRQYCNNSEIIEFINDSIDNSKKDILLKKTKREKEYGVITDNLTGVTYYEKDDPINYRKAKKRIQNRESALRMKKLRENNNSKIDEELNRLKEDNLKQLKTYILAHLYIFFSFSFIN